MRAERASLVLVLVIADVPFASLARQSLNSSGGASPVWFSAAFAVVGSVVAWRKPGNPVGWLFLAGAIINALSQDASFYAVADYRLRHGSLPFGWVAVLAQPGWAPGIAVAGLAVLLFPDGRPPSRRWRWVLWVFLAASALWVGGVLIASAGAIAGHHIRVDASGNLLVLSHPAGRRCGGPPSRLCSCRCWRSAGWVRWRPRCSATGGRPGNAASS